MPFDFCLYCAFFFFKQKTAYEMRISDWSSDVCSSDLLIVTTRFPRDSAARYAAETDFGEWGHRLEVFGLDLRHTPSVEAFCAQLLRSEERRVGKECVSTCRSRWSTYY